MEINEDEIKYTKEEAIQLYENLIKDADKFFNLRHIGILTIDNILNSAFRYFYEESLFVYDLFQKDFYLSQLKEYLPEDLMLNYNNYLKEKFKKEILNIDLNDYKRIQVNSFKFISLEKDKLKILFKKEKDIHLINEDGWMEIKKEIWEIINLIMDNEYEEYANFYKDKKRFLELYLNFLNVNGVTYPTLDNLTQEVLNYLTDEQITTEIINKIKNILEKEDEIFKRIIKISHRNYDYILKNDEF